MFALLSLALANPFEMNDAGLVLDLPGWEGLRWSDWDFRGKNNDGPMAVEVWYTAFQAEMTEDFGKEQAALYRSRLEAVEHAKNTRLEELTITPMAGRRTALLSMRFNFDRVGAKGILYGASFAGEGKTIQVAVYGPLEASAKLERARNQLLEKLKQTKPPATIDAGPLLGSFGSVTLPEGWRAPLASEEKDLAKITAITGETDVSPCVRAIHPGAMGEADLLLLCPRSWHFGIIDEASFVDIEPQLRTKLYGKAADKVDPGRLLSFEDRSAVTFAPKLNDYVLRTTLVPYENQILSAMIVGKGDTEALESTLKTVVSGIAWSGPDHGKPSYTSGETLMHGLNYDTFHPLKLLCGSLSLALFAWIGRSFMKRKDAVEI